jgi:DNA-binding NarL/FixJ family response regulator
MPRARVLLAEDHPAVAQQLKGLLATEFDVIAVVPDGFALLDAAAGLKPDVIVCDIEMPGMDGIVAATEILKHDPATRVVFVTVHDEPALVERGLACGALGYVQKLTAGDDLLPAVQSALRGERHVSPELRTRARRKERP